MSETHVYGVPDALAKSALVNEENYFRDYARSITDPEDFWREKAKIVDWIKPFTKVKNSRSPATFTSAGFMTAR